MDFIKKIISSRSGQIFFLVHFILFILCLVTLRETITITQYESHYLRYLFTIIVALDFLILYPLNNLAHYFQVKTTLPIQSLMGLIASFQWWIIGFLIEVFLKFSKRMFKSSEV